MVYNASLSLYYSDIMMSIPMKVIMTFIPKFIDNFNNIKFLLSFFYKLEQNKFRFISMNISGSVDNVNISIYT